MCSKTTIGRVGPLAFALGAGVIIGLSSPGVAAADSTDSAAAHADGGGHDAADSSLKQPRTLRTTDAVRTPRRRTEARESTDSGTRRQRSALSSSSTVDTEVADDGERPRAAEGTGRRFGRSHREVTPASTVATQQLSSVAVPRTADSTKPAVAVEDPATAPRPSAQSMLMTSLIAMSRRLLGSDEDATIGSPVSARSALTDTSRVSLGPRASRVAVSGTYSYLTNWAGNSVSVVDNSTQAVVSTIGAIFRPTAIAVSADGSKVYVAGQNTLRVIDTATRTTVSRLFVGGGSAYSIALDDSGSRLYVAQQAVNRVLTVDVSGRAVKVISRLSVGFQPGLITLSPDGTLAYVLSAQSNGLRVINTATNQVVRIIAADAAASGVAVSPDGGRLYVTNPSAGTLSVLNAANGAVAATVTVGDQPGSVVVSRDGAAVYIATSGNKVVAVTTADNTIASVANLGGVSGGTYLLQLSADGKTLWGFDVNNRLLKKVVFPTPPAPGTGTNTTPYLPIDMPTGPSAQKVFAHYVPWMPISYDNLPGAVDYYATQLMSIMGENGIHAAYGGYLRDRPLLRDTISDPNWKYLDVLTEVKQARSVGIDGFTVDITSPALQNDTVTNLLKAAASTPGFSIQPQADLSSPYLTNISASDFAAAFAPYLSSPGAFKLSDGRSVLSAFYADGKSVAWWSSALKALKTTYGIDVAFVPTFLDAGAHMADFAPISYGFGNWGARNARDTDPANAAPGSQVDLVRTAHQMGKIWMQPIAFQDNRPRNGLYNESANSLTNTNTWDIAINERAEWVQMVTWNDYAEGTAMAPSVEHGWSLLDMQAFEIAKYKYGAGAAPVIRDAVYVSHRTQFATSESTYVETIPMQIWPNTPAPVDNVEVVVYAKAASVVTVSIGGVQSSCSVGAGRSVCSFPLREGQVGVTLARGGATIAAVNSPYTVTNTPYTQNMDYHVAGGLR